MISADTNHAASDVLEVPTPIATGAWLNKISRACSLWLARLQEKLFLNAHADRFYRIFGGHLHFQMLYTAVELDLFTILQERGAMDETQIAKALGIELQPCRILLLGLVANKLLHKNGERYCNRLIGKLLLDKNSPKNVLAYVRLQHHVMYKAAHHMLESVRSYKNAGLREFAGDEPTLYARLTHNPATEVIFQDAMQQLSVQTNRYLAQFVDFSACKYVVDVGGGDGTNLMAILKKNPHLKGAVFDFPSVCQIARENFAKHGCDKRLDAIPGNAFTDSYPAQADCFLFCHFFTIWSKEEDLVLLKRAHQALPAGGRAAIFNMMQHDDRTGPLSAAVGSPYFLSCATGRGMLYTWQEYEELFRQAGFRDIKRVKLPRDHGIIVGIK